jgi:hypothetical protein
VLNVVVGSILIAPVDHANMGRRALHVIWSVQQL